MMTWLANMLIRDRDADNTVPMPVADGDIRYATARLRRLEGKLAELAKN